DLVFCDELGGFFDKSGVSRYSLHRILEKAGQPRKRFHDLRHTAATLLLGCGVDPKIVSEMLGHASIAITLEIHSHVLPDMQAQTAAVMDAALCLD
ncbi:MAG TPA: tyrosine-type recombinase/integrase, partial [Ktedonobacterales bacterium]|nr:tyrosine-type recombinase/integrase [Ktedonobacterales bacterium]